MLRWYNLPCYLGFTKGSIRCKRLLWIGKLVVKHLSSLITIIGLLWSSILIIISYSIVQTLEIIILSGLTIVDVLRSITYMNILMLKVKNLSTPENKIEIYWEKKKKVLIGRREREVRMTIILWQHLNTVTVSILGQGSRQF